MAQVRKFGAFAGVFTPSILTILGVIMYLRLPNIVGQAGLFQTLGIIAVAHIISVATGLSVSSIATDKKVKAGGTYYIISRSLGLPVGGTLGLALFVGLSFSVSLYLIGFSESFLGYWGLPADIGTLRIAGTLALTGVTIVTLISTALALKTQFYIMTAIALSLLSILLGRHEFAPAAPLLHPIADAAPFIVLFGIFFPAVTGFEAGVSMSGDLKDPKRAIPAGTISAIVIGLVAYIGLATFFAFTVDSEQLTANPNVLLDIALFPPLVIAGIWGATISSAFGSILSAPRILQATATDGITPHWFGMGYGRENEPRHALVPAFLIAEAGILIGELDVIARIVSMFFITTYGFLNLTAAIESWVSPDFRPDFRVPRFVAVIGSIACFVVMIQLDFLAMLGASLLLGGLYLLLTRRQLRLETGDTWEGVWSSLARSALLRLDAGLTHRRNWRPNVLLFSGSLAARPHLVEFARQLAGSRGLVTNFNLVETESTPPPERSPLAGEDAVAASGALPSWGVFTRQVPVPDVYSGIAHIADHYGFAGIEPNTVIMGYARNSRDPQRFTELLQHLADGDLNILLVDFDPDRGWGRRQRIDVWWRLAGSDVSFGLALIRFLGNADEWRDAEVRFLTVNDHDSAFNASILRDMGRVLDEHRVQAEVRVIDNVTERRPFPEIIRGESIDADLTVLGLSDLREGDPARFVADTNSIVGVLGTVVLAHASSFFAEPLVRAAAALRAPTPAPETEVSAPNASARLGETDMGAPESVAVVARAVLRDLRADLESDFEEFVHRIFEIDRAFVSDVGDLTARALADLTAAGKDGAMSAGDEALRSRDDLVRSALERIERERTEGASARAALLTGFGDRLAAAVAARLHQVPDRLDVVPDPDPVGMPPTGSGGLFRRKAGHRARARMLLEAQLWTFGTRARAALRQSVSAAAVQSAAVTQRWLETAIPARAALERMRESGSSTAVRGASVQEDTPRDEIEDALRQSADEEDRIAREIDTQAVGAVVSFAREASAPQRRRAEREARSMEAAARTESVRIEESVDALPAALELLLNGSTLGLGLALARDRVHREAALTRSRLQEAIFEPTIRRLERLGSVLHQVRGALDPDSAAEVETAVHYHLALGAPSLLAGLAERFDAHAVALPSSLAVISAETDTFLAEGRPEEVGATELPVREVFEYLVRTEVLAPLLDETTRALDEVEASADVCREVAQLAAFELRAPEDSARAVGGGTGFDVIVRSGMERIEREVGRLREAGASFDEAVHRHFQGLVARMDPFSFGRVAGRLQQYVRSERGRGLVGGLTRLGRRAGRLFAEQATGLAYRRSEGVLLARRLEREGLEGRGPGLRVGRLVKSVSPRADVLETLPTFYRQLFLGGAAVSGDTSGFEAELAEAEAAVQAHRRGKRGALFIVAEHGHGRATLSTMLTRRLFPRGTVFRLDPVEGGSIDPDNFELRLATALRMPREDAPRMIARMPAGSALVLHDLGLWWERSPGGNAVLDIIIGLMERFDDRCLFIVNANIHAFRLMNRIQPMDDRILKLIECEPFHARELKELVLLRAGAGGLGFTIDGRPDEALSDWRIARFFDALFGYCNGNVGAALSAWITSIREVEDDTVHVVTPRRPRLEPFSDLGPIQRMIGVQLAIHDRATQDRLVRITRLDRAVLAREMRVLESCGLLVQRAGGAYQIDRFARPHFVRFLTQEGLL